MNKSELINGIADRTNIDETIISEVLNAFEATIYDAIRKGESVYLYKFMKIERKTKKEYVGHGIGTNEKIVIPAHDVVKIKPEASLIKCVSG